jgi:hypothetical protein
LGEGGKRFYSFSCCSDNLICAAYYSSDVLGGNVMEIHIMDWNGNPVCKLILDRKIKDFTVDFDSGFMYAVSLEEERIYRYDISLNSSRISSIALDSTFGFLVITMFVSASALSFCPIS